MKFEQGPPHQTARCNPAPDAPATAFDPSEEWEDAFEQQATQTLIKRTRRFAVYRARFLGELVPDIPAYAEDLVSQILIDTVDGILTWDHHKRSLEDHVKEHIRQRARRDGQRAARQPHASIDDDVLDTHNDALASAEAALASESPVATADTESRAEEVLAALFELAATSSNNESSGEPRAEGCIRYLGALANGATTKEEIMELGQLTESGYRAARRRVADLVAQLPLYLQPHPALKKGDRS